MVVAVLRGHSKVTEIYIEGDGLWAVFDTRTKPEVDEAFSADAKVASLVDILNIKLAKSGYSEIAVGIGLDDVLDRVGARLGRGDQLLSGPIRDRGALCRGGDAHRVDGARGRRRR